MKSKVYCSIARLRKSRQVSFMLDVEILRKCAKDNVHLWAREFVSLQRIFGMNLTQVYEIEFSNF